MRTGKAAQTRSSQANALSTEGRHSRQTIMSLRAALEQSAVDTERLIQAVRAEANLEIENLRETAKTLRRQLELAADASAAQMQEVTALHFAQVGQLEASVRILRDELQSLLVKSDHVLQAQREQSAREQQVLHEQIRALRAQLEKQ